MKPTIYYQFVLLVLAIGKIDANINIFQTGIKPDNTSFECGTELLLSCQIEHFSVSMTWQNDKNILPVADCTFGVCSLHPSLVDLYEFSPDMSTGIFNLTVLQLSLDNNNTVYSCADGTNSNETLITVKDFEPTIEANTSGEIKVICGCIDPDTDLSIKWKKVKNGTENELTFKPENITQSFTTTNCTGDVICGPSYYVQKSKSIILKPGDDGDYLLKAVCEYDGVEVESKLTNHTYKIEDEVCPVCVFDDCCILLIVAGSALLIHIVLGLLLFVTWKDRDNSADDEYFPSAFEYLIVLSVLLWIVMFAVYIGSLVTCFEDEDDCSCLCSKIVRAVGIIFLILLGIHIILGCILLYVLYCRNGTVVKNDDKCSTSNATFIRSICSTIPVAGLFAVCQWLISVYRSEKPAMQNKKKDPLDKGKTEQKSSKGSVALPDISPKKSGRKLSKSAQRRENEKIDKHISTERSDLSRQSKGETDKVSTSGVILKNKANVKNEFSKSNESSTAVESARNNVPPNSTVDHNEKGIRSENRSDNGGSITNSSSKKKKKTSRAKLESSTVDKTSRGDPHKPLSTEEQTSTSRKHVTKKKSDGSPSPSTDNSSNPPTSHITSPNSTKVDQIKSHSGEEHANTSHGNVKHVIVRETKQKSGGRPSPITEKYSNLSTSNITSKNSTNGDQYKSHSGEEHTKSETMKRALSANFTDDDDDTTEVSDDHSKTLNRENTPL